MVFVREYMRTQRIILRFVGWVLIVAFLLLREGIVGWKNDVFRGYV